MSRLSDLKPGDRAIVLSHVGRHREASEVVAVASVSPTGRIRINDGRTFHPDGSIRPKPRRGGAVLVPATPENLNPARVRELRDAISACDGWHRWSLAKLERVWAAMTTNDEGATT